ncbi:toxin glutamine deamidase domain-containing protein [Lentzea sp. CA-135723]|uniref:toxin glutamine deamidase domain-containing protein n=1 Tax=Lentzea sp. CA-135723 TaxID=3239950 RepID=UPI003D8B9ED1
MALTVFALKLPDDPAHRGWRGLGDEDLAVVRTHVERQIGAAKAVGQPTGRLQHFLDFTERLQWQRAVQSTSGQATKVPAWYTRKAAFKALGGPASPEAIAGLEAWLQGKSLAEVGEIVTELHRTRPSEELHDAARRVQAFKLAAAHPGGPQGYLNGLRERSADLRERIDDAELKALWKPQVLQTRAERVKEAARRREIADLTDQLSSANSRIDALTRDRVTATLVDSLDKLVADPDEQEIVRLAPRVLDDLTEHLARQIEAAEHAGFDTAGLEALRERLTDEQRVREVLTEVTMHGLERLQARLRDDIESLEGFLARKAAGPGIGGMLTHVLGGDSSLDQRIRDNEALIDERRRRLALVDHPAYRDRFANALGLHAKLHNLNQTTERVQEAAERRQAEETRLRRAELRRAAAEDSSSRELSERQLHDAFRSTLFGKSLAELAHQNELHRGNPDRRLEIEQVTQYQEMARNPGGIDQHQRDLLARIDDTKREITALTHVLDVLPDVLTTKPMQAGREKRREDRRRLVEHQGALMNQLDRLKFDRRNALTVLALSLPADSEAGWKLLTPRDVELVEDNVAELIRHARVAGLVTPQLDDLFDLLWNRRIGDPVALPPDEHAGPDAQEPEPAVPVTEAPAGTRPFQRDPATLSEHPDVDRVLPGGLGPVQQGTPLKSFEASLYGIDAGKLRELRQRYEGDPRRADVIRRMIRLSHDAVRPDLYELRVRSAQERLTEAEAARSRRRADAELEGEEPGRDRRLEWFQDRVDQLADDRDAALTVHALGLPADPGDAGWRRFDDADLDAVRAHAERRLHDAEEGGHPADHLRRFLDFTRKLRRERVPVPSRGRTTRPAQYARAGAFRALGGPESPQARAGVEAWLESKSPDEVGKIAGDFLRAGHQGLHEVAQRILLFKRAGAHLDGPQGYLNDLLARSAELRRRIADTKAAATWTPAALRSEESRAREAARSAEVEELAGLLADADGQIETLRTHRDHVGLVHALDAFVAGQDASELDHVEDDLLAELDEHLARRIEAAETAGLDVTGLRALHERVRAEPDVRRVLAEAAQHGLDRLTTRLDDTRESLSRLRSGAADKAGLLGRVTGWGADPELAQQISDAEEVIARTERQLAFVGDPAYRNRFLKAADLYSHRWRSQHAVRKAVRAADNLVEADIAARRRRLRAETAAATAQDPPALSDQRVRAGFRASLFGKSPGELSLLTARHRGDAGRLADIEHVRRYRAIAGTPHELRRQAGEPAAGPSGARADALTILALALPPDPAAPDWELLTPLDVELVEDHVEGLILDARIAGVPTPALDRLHDIVRVMRMNDAVAFTPQETPPAAPRSDARPFMVAAGARPESPDVDLVLPGGFEPVLEGTPLGSFEASLYGVDTGTLEDMRQAYGRDAERLAAIERMIGLAALAQSPAVYDRRARMAADLLAKAETEQVRWSAADLLPDRFKTRWMRAAAADRQDDVDRNVRSHRELVDRFADNRAAALAVYALALPDDPADDRWGGLGDDDLAAVRAHVEQQVRDAAPGGHPTGHLTLFLDFTRRLLDDRHRQDVRPAPPNPGLRTTASPPAPGVRHGEDVLGDESWRHDPARTAGWFAPDVPGDPDEWADRREGAHVRTVDLVVHDLRTDSTPKKPRSFHGLVRYDLRRIETRPGRFVQEYTVRLHLDPAHGVSPDTVRRVKATALDGVNSVLNKGYRVPSGDLFHLNLEFTDDPADAHATVRVDPAAAVDQTRWGPDSSPKALAHEVLHYLGVPDEYQDPSRVFLRRGGNSGVHENDGGLMGTDVHGVDPGLRPRHLWLVERTANSQVMVPDTRLDEPAVPRVAPVRDGGAVPPATRRAPDRARDQLRLLAETPVTGVRRDADVHLWTGALAEAGFGGVKRVFLVGETTYSAVAVRGEGDGYLVLDPAVDAHTPLTVAQWAAALGVEVADGDPNQVVEWELGETPVRPRYEAAPELERPELLIADAAPFAPPWADTRPDPAVRRPFADWYGSLSGEARARFAEQAGAMSALRLRFFHDAFPATGEPELFPSWDTVVEAARAHLAALDEERRQDLAYYAGESVAAVGSDLDDETYRELYDLATYWADVLPRNEMRRVVGLAAADRGAEVADDDAESTSDGTEIAGPGSDFPLFRRPDDVDSSYYHVFTAGEMTGDWAPELDAAPPRLTELLHRAVPPGTAFAEPGSFVRLINGSVLGQQGRLENCVDCALAFLETWQGRPRTAGAGEGVQELNVKVQYEMVRRSQGHHPEWVGRGPAALTRVIEAVREGGHGAGAVVLGNGLRHNGHAWNVVNHRGTVHVVDPQFGTVVPADGHVHPAMFGVYALVLDGRGARVEDLGVDPGNPSISSGSVDEPETRDQRFEPVPDGVTTTAGGVHVYQRPFPGVDGDLGQFADEWRAEAESAADLLARLPDDVRAEADAVARRLVASRVPAPVAGETAGEAAQSAQLADEVRVVVAHTYVQFGLELATERGAELRDRFGLEPAGTDRPHLIPLVDTAGTVFGAGFVSSAEGPADPRPGGSAPLRRIGPEFAVTEEDRTALLLAADVLARAGGRGERADAADDRAR